MNDLEFAEVKQLENAGVVAGDDYWRALHIGDAPAMKTAVARWQQIRAQILDLTVENRHLSFPTAVGIRNFMGVLI